MASQEYHPRSSDAARAGEALPDDFLHQFKQSLVADYKDFIASSDFVPFIIPTTSQSATGISTQNIQPSRELLEVNIDAESGPGQHDERAITLAQKVPGIGSMGVSDLNYPLSLFDGFPDPPPATIVEDLTRTFEVAFLRKVPFLSSLTNLDSSILAGLIGSAPVAPYLAFGRALVGTLVSKNEDCQRWASNLYKTTLKLFVGSVELDNRTSRNIFWYEAGMLLVIYGTLGSDYALWETTNMVNGYFLAPYKRRGFLQVGDPRGSLDSQDLSLLTSFYFLIDVFRSIHLNTPPSFNPRDLSFPLTTTSAGRFEDLYAQIILNRRILSPELTPDEYLLAILCILSEIVHLLRFLGLFTDESLHNTVQTFDDRGENCTNEPYLPSSANREYLHQSEALRQSLDVWYRSVNYRQPEISSRESGSSDRRAQASSDYSTLKVNRNVLSIAFFCRILLEIGPRALYLPQIVGYHELAPDRKDLRSGDAEKAQFPGVHVSDISVESAWKVLEVLDDERYESNLSESNSENTNEHHMVPLWLPLVVFYAGITVWARMKEDQDRGVLGIQSSPMARRQLLKSFHNELRSLGKQYKSASRMADVIKSLYP